MLKALSAKHTYSTSLLLLVVFTLNSSGREKVDPFLGKEEAKDKKEFREAGFEPATCR